MIDHKHHLIENGTMLSCNAFGCPTKGKPFLLAGGDQDGGPDLGGPDLEFLLDVNKEKRLWIESVRTLEKDRQNLLEQNAKLKKENEALRDALKGFCPGFFGEENGE